MIKFIKITLGVLVITLCGNRAIGADNVIILDPEYYGKYMQDALKEMTCSNKQDGFYPDITDLRGFYQCVNGIRYPLGQCQDETNDLIYDPDCRCCNWNEGVINPYMKKCNTAEYMNACDCRDNSDAEKRGPGACSCNPNGVGMDYSGCTATPPCPAIINSAGSDAAMRDSYGSCYAPTGIGFGDISGGFEFSENCYYSD